MRRKRIRHLLMPPAVILIRYTIIEFSENIKSLSPSTQQVIILHELLHLRIYAMLKGVKKKLIFLICILILVNMLYSQDSKGIYFVVEAKNRPESMEPLGLVLKHRYYAKNYSYKDSITIFNAYVNTSNIPVLRLWHFYRIKPKSHETSVNPKDQHKVFLKDSSFLSTVDCLYWDDIKDLNRGETEIYIGPLLFHKMPDGKKVKRTIYVVDLAEKHPANQIQIYQVEDMKSGGWFISTYSKEDEKQSWVQHEKAIREKIDQRREQRKEKLVKK